VLVILMARYHDEFWRDENVAENEQTPGFVHHYTSVATMTKIVESRQIWATSISYLNDTREREGFLTEAVKMMPNLAADAGYDASAFEEYLRDGHTPIAEVSFLPSVSSFSRYSDSLPQWRSYCSQGNGISIGFDVDCLKMAQVIGDISLEWECKLLQIPVPVSFRKVNYVHNADYATVRRVLVDSYHKALASRDGNSMSLPRPLGQYLKNILENEAATYKDLSFSTEEEFRIIAGPVLWRPLLLHFRPTQSSLIPYLELDIPNSNGVVSKESVWDAIKEVTIGPNVNSELTARAVRAFFAAKNMKVYVKTTDVSYRDW
jgi:hypothetical protein